MKNSIVLLSVFANLLLSASSYAKEEFATKKQAEAMVVKTVSDLKSESSQNAGRNHSPEC